MGPRHVAKHHEGLYTTVIEPNLLKGLARTDVASPQNNLCSQLEFISVYPGDNYSKIITWDSNLIIL